MSENGFINIYIEDEAGNIIVRSYEVDSIDRAAPVIEVTINTATYQQSSDAVVGIEITDDISGVKDVYYCFSSILANRGIPILPPK